MTPNFFRCIPLAFLLPLLTLAWAEGPQAKLPVLQLRIGDKTVAAEVADENHERQTGLMHRESLGANEGMLFIMDRPEQTAFWMKNTKVPLTIAYISPAGVILELHDLEPLNEKPVASAFRNIAYALEMRRGWFSDNRVLPGDRIIGLPPLPKPTP